MGVKGLWTLFGPYCERISLYEIKGERVAIDLSGWVCDSQNVADHHAQPRLYLRNLFFRTTYLLFENVTPIFVLEGEAPVAKGTTMANRNLVQFRGCAKKLQEGKKLKKPDRQRKRFSNVLANCEKLLKSMGLECVQGLGEAEAMCAHLNSTGAVSAVVSQDSDCFVYGATRVYRNFSVSNTGFNSANAGSVDVYDLNNIKRSINFGRNKMVAMALLCGSDYNGNGIEGVGYSNAVAFLSQYSDEEILDRLKSWSSDTRLYEKLRLNAEDNSKCSSCGHLGTLRSHTKSGCSICRTHSGCDESTYKTYRTNIKIELNIRKKALDNCDSFPDNDLIDEFLIDKEETPIGFRPRWRKPDLIKFMKIMTQYLGWTEYYCVEKFLPLLTRWQLLQMGGDRENDDISLLINNTNHQSWVTPLCIKKKRTPKGVPCYEVLWQDSNKYYEGLVPDDQLQDNDEEKLWTTVERQDLMKAAYPDIVDAFLQSKIKPKKTSKRTKKDVQSKNLMDLNESMKNLSFATNTSQAKSKKRKLNASFKTKPKKYKMNGKQKRLDSFFKKNSSIKSIKDKSTLTPLLDDTDDHFSDEELSCIIDGILKRNDEHSIIKCLNRSSPKENLTPVKPLSFRKFSDIHNMVNDFCSTPVQKNNNRRISYFFGNLDDQEDAFEQSLELRKGSDLKNLSFNLPTQNSSKECKKSLESPPYTPLMERVRKLRQFH